MILQKSLNIVYLSMIFLINVKKIIFLYIKDAFNLSKVTIKTFMSQNISIPKKTLFF